MGAKATAYSYLFCFCSKYQGWEFTLSIFRSSLFWSRWSLKKRVTVRESLLISLKESDVSDLLVIRAYCSQKRAIRSKKRIFLMFLSDFHSFPHSYNKRANCSHYFSLSCSFIKIDGNYSLSSLVTKEQLWARIAPVNLVLKNDCERIDPGYL